MMAAKKKAPTKKAPAKNKGGAPTKYQSSFPSQVYKMKREGKGDRYVADFWGISTGTLHTWKEEHPEFLSQYKSGLDDYNTDMVDSCRNALLKKAIGTTVKEVTVEEVIVDGVAREKTKTVTKQLPPSEIACLAILNNKSNGEFMPVKAADRVEDEEEAPPLEITFSVNEPVGEIKTTIGKKNADSK